MGRPGAESGAIGPTGLVFVDEGVSSTALTRRYGRARRVTRFDTAGPHGRWKVVTLTAAVRVVGVGTCPIFAGATDTSCFAAYVGRCLAPTLQTGAIVVMDNYSRDEVTK